MLAYQNLLLFIPTEFANTVDLDMHQKIPICPKLMFCSALKGTQNECLSINIPFYILE